MQLAMSQPRSDALVFLGITGDLAYKKIFPALYAMARRGHLDVPVIGVARSNYVRFRLSPEVTIAIGAMVKQAGERMIGEPTELRFTHHTGGDEMDAYDRLLGDAMQGDPTPFCQARRRRSRLGHRPVYSGPGWARLRVRAGDMGPGRGAAIHR